MFLRWSARAATLFVAGTFALLIVGELVARYPGSGSPIDLREWIGFALLAGTWLGMVMAWRWELPGASLSLIAWALFLLIIPLENHVVQITAAVPGVLFLADWAARRVHHTARTG